VRIIKNNDLVLVEYALRTVLADEASAPVWPYQTARCYAERYDSGHCTGLTPASAPLVQDIVDFWAAALGLDVGAVSPAGQGMEPRRKGATRSIPSAPSGRGSTPGKGKRKATFTHRQGQFLAFIHLYRKLHRQGPAELDLVQYFRVTPPSAHGMVVKLEQRGLITREPGVARSVRPKGRSRGDSQPARRVPGTALEAHPVGGEDLHHPRGR
jgi:repressor LexA